MLNLKIKIVASGPRGIKLWRGGGGVRKGSLGGGMGGGWGPGDKKLLQTISIDITCAQTNFGILAFFHTNRAGLPGAYFMRRHMGRARASIFFFCRRYIGE